MRRMHNQKAITLPSQNLSISCISADICGRVKACRDHGSHFCTALQLVAEFSLTDVATPVTFHGNRNYSHQFLPFPL
jgi:hypothetical protein